MIEDGVGGFLRGMRILEQGYIITKEVGIYWQSARYGFVSSR
jgi:hypothetical protein